MKKQLLSLILIGFVVQISPAQDVAKPEQTKSRILANIARYSEGEYRDVNFPDTLDIQARTELALRGMLNLAAESPGKPYMPYYGFLFHNPPLLGSPEQGMSLFTLEAIQASRAVTGSDYKKEIEAVWREDVLNVLKSNFKGQDIGGGHILIYLANAWAMEDVTSIRPQILASLDAALADWPARAANNDQSRRELNPRRGYGFELNGVTQFYLAARYEPARKLSEQMTRFFMTDPAFFDFNRRFPFVGEETVGNGAHFYHHSNVLMALSQAYMIHPTPELKRFLIDGYRFATSGTAGSNARVGFFPEYAGDWPDDRWRANGNAESETCCLASMIRLAINLSQAGVSDCWDDADAWIRNQFTESQITRTDWIPGAIAVAPSNPMDKFDNHALKPCSDPNKFMGSFPSWGGAGDFQCRWESGPPSFCVCCLASGTRALFDIWNAIDDVDGKTVRINLAMNKAAQWGTVRSWIPYEGKIEIEVARDADIEVRIPSWASTAKVACRVGDAVRTPAWKGRYACLAGLKKGDKAVFTFPISEYKLREIIGGNQFVVTFRGADVVQIEPSGTYYKYYSTKGRYRSGEAQIIKTRRFIANKSLELIRPLQ